MPLFRTVMLCLYGILNASIVLGDDSDKFSKLQIQLDFLLDERIKDRQEFEGGRQKDHYLIEKLMEDRQKDHQLIENLMEDKQKARNKIAALRTHVHHLEQHAHHEAKRFVLPGQGTILQRRKKPVKFAKEEIILILRAYLTHPTKWSDILDDVKENLQQLTPPAQELYRSGTTKQLRDRMSTKLSCFMAKDPGTIANLEIRALVEQVRNLEQRLVERQPLHVRQEVVAPAPAQGGPAQEAQGGPAQEAHGAPAHAVHGAPAHVARGAPVQAARDLRAEAAAALPQSSSDEDQADEDRPPRGRKRPLTELIRENQMVYSNFMKKKMPKILRELGISSDSD